MSEQRFQSGRHTVIAHVRVLGHGGGVRVAPASERRLLGFGELVRNAPVGVGLSRGADELRRFGVQGAHRKPQRLRKQRAHVQIIDRVAEIGERQSRQRKRVGRALDVQMTDQIGMYTHTHISYLLFSPNATGILF